MVQEKLKFLIFFQKSTSGYQVRCSIDRSDWVSYPYTGFLKKGREMTAEGARRYARKHIEHRRGTKEWAQYDYVIDESGLEE